MDLYINEYGSRINLNNGVITISKEGKILKEIPLKKIGSLVIHSSVQITSQAIAALILILDQPIDKLSAIISSFCVKLPCQATACLRSLFLTELILSVDFVYRTIEN